MLLGTVVFAGESNALGTFMSSDMVNAITRSSIKHITPIWFGIALAALAVRYGWIFVTASFESALMEQGNLPVNYMDMARSMFFVLLIGIYPQLYAGIESVLKGINDATDPSTEVYGNIRDISNTYYISTQIKPEVQIVKNAFRAYEAAKKTGDKKLIAAKKLVLEETAMEVTIAGLEAMETADGTVDGKEGRLRAKSSAHDSGMGVFGMLDPIQMMGMTLNAILGMVAMGIKWVIELWAKFSFGIVGGLGMIALTFGIWNPSIPAQWFSKLVNIGLTFTVLNILDQQMGTFWLYALDNGLVMNGTEIGNGIALHIAIIASYASAFTITGWVVGASGAGKIAGKAIGITSLMVAAAAATAAAAISGGGSVGASAAGSGAQAIGRSFQSGTKNMNDE